MNLDWRRRSTICAVLALLTQALVACGSGSTPPEVNTNPPSLTAVTTPPPTDTIDAMPDDPYVLRVTNGDGTPVVSTAVAFTGINAEVGIPGLSFAPSTSVQTDSRGEVAVAIRYGSEPGPGSVVARVPTMQLADTLELDVTHGRAVRAVITPGDTLVVISTTFIVSASALDRRGNMAGAPLPLTVEYGPLSVSGPEVTAEAMGEARLTASVGDSIATVSVVVVPDGEVAYTSGYEALLTRLDGTGTRDLEFTVPPARESSVSWDRYGDRIVVGGFDGFVVYDLETLTSSPATWPGDLAGSNIIWPRFGPQGRIYYSSSDGGLGWDLRSAESDGSSPEIVIPTDAFPNNDFFPDWAPDASAFVFTADWEEHDRFLLRITDPDVTSVTTIDIEGVTPVWSPDGSMIAYQELGVVGVVAPDGTNGRSWDPGWSKGVTWSPDGRHLVGIDGRQISVLDVETGETLVLAHLGNGMDAVAWRPEPAAP